MLPPPKKLKYTHVNTHTRARTSDSPNPLPYRVDDQQIRGGDARRTLREDVIKSGAVNFSLHDVIQNRETHAIRLGAEMCARVWRVRDQILLTHEMFAIQRGELLRPMGQPRGVALFGSLDVRYTNDDNTTPRNTDMFILA